MLEIPGLRVEVQECSRRTIQAQREVLRALEAHGPRIPSPSEEQLSTLREARRAEHDARRNLYERLQLLSLRACGCPPD